MPVTSHGRAIPGGAAGNYTGGKGNWGSGPIINGGGGAGEASTKTRTKTKTTSQSFTVKCFGLKPNTVHNFFYEGVDFGKSCLPVYPKPTNAAVKLGSPLKTDSEGKIEFVFYFNTDVEKTVDGKKKYELAGDKKFELTAVNSSASKVVPFKKYSKSNSIWLGTNR